MAFPTSNLSQENVLRDVHDPVAQALRTTANATIVVPGGLEVNIDYSEDSVAIGDPASNNVLSINPDGSINVLDISEPVGDVISLFGEVSAVVSGITTDIITYTIPAGKTLKLSQIEFGGSNISMYEIVVDGGVIARKRTNFGTTLFGTFEFSVEEQGLELTAGQVLKLRTRHDRTSVGDFEARILGVLV